MNKIPSQKVTLRIVPGNTPQQSNLLLDANITHPIRAEIGMLYQNTSPNIKKNCTPSYQLSLDNMLSMNDNITIHCTHNMSIKQKDKQRNIAITAHFPLGYYTISGQYKNDYNTQNIINTTQVQPSNLFINKKAEESITLKRLLYKTSNSNYNLGISVLFKTLSSQYNNNNINIHDKKIATYIIQYDHTWPLWDGNLYYQCMYHQNFYALGPNTTATTILNKQCKYHIIKNNIIWSKYIHLSHCILKYQLYIDSQYTPSLLLDMDHFQAAQQVSHDQGISIKNQITINHLLPWKPMQPLQLSLSTLYGHANNHQLNFINYDKSKQKIIQIMLGMLYNTRQIQWEINWTKPIYCKSIVPVKSKDYKGNLNIKFTIKYPM